VVLAPGRSLVRGVGIETMDFEGEIHKSSTW
jgi:hypothetical protein